jgi:transposase
VEKFRTLEHLKAQVTVVRWHLDAATLGNGEKKRRHLDSAALTYQGAVELLGQLVLPDADHAAVTRQLAELKDRLRAAGQSV